MTPEQRIYAADRAREVLDNEDFTAAFDDIEKEVTEQWKTSPARDAAGRQELWVYLSMLRKVKAHLTTAMDTGKLAKLDIAHKQSMLERAGTILWER